MSPRRVRSRVNPRGIAASAERRPRWTPRRCASGADGDGGLADPAPREAVGRAGGPIALELPQSRKTRALLAYLAVTQREHTRDRLCRLLWPDVDDPRGALRWSLSKLRVFLSDAARERLVASRDTVAFDGRDVDVDVLRVRRVALGRERRGHVAGAEGGGGRVRRRAARGPRRARCARLPRLVRGPAGRGAAPGAARARPARGAAPRATGGGDPVRTATRPGRARGRGTPRAAPDLARFGGTGARGRAAVPRSRALARGTRTKARPAPAPGLVGDRKGRCERRAPPRGRADAAGTGDPLLRGAGRRPDRLRGRGCRTAPRQGGQLAQPSGVRLGEPGVAPLDARAVPRPPLVRYDERGNGLSDWAPRTSRWQPSSPISRR